MGLIVSPVILITDVILFLVIAYATIYSFRRLHRYSEPFNRFILVVAISTLIATIGRTIDLIDDFFVLSSYLELTEEILYFISIIGVIYGVISYIHAVESQFFVKPAGKNFDGSLLSAGGFIYFGNRNELVAFLRGSSVPTLVFTREPWIYEGLENVQTVWITSASENGISPTSMHVLLETALNFLRGGGKLIVVDCLEVLILYNDWKTVFRFLTTLKDYAINFRGALLISIEEGVLEENQEVLLKREFRLIQHLEELFKTSSLS
jgi:hypothetical protein